MARPKSEKAPAPSAPVEDNWDEPEAEAQAAEPVAPEAQPEPTDAQRAEARNTPPEPKPAPAPVIPQAVRVRCISENFPWTDRKWLKLGEEADVSPEIADLMVSRKQVERV